ncbi:hypothetical protein L917_17947 [Phytophthora nicotianae]|uniref:Uncharacterized protein n=1 Tax=Phytophthora nicotianae TaxID=4792 RepID=W2KB76_PHYNI|nr:hypothetical protein L917_17947 [Phytophthora nicotianae]ETM35002.1 hypothetical protein L914_18033 [Phytophthora nicotianae]
MSVSDLLQAPIQPEQSVHLSSTQSAKSVLLSQRLGERTLHD